MNPPSSETNSIESGSASTSDESYSGQSVPLLVVAMILPTIVTYIYFYVLADADESVQKVSMSLCKIVQFGLPIIWVLGVRRYRGAVGWPHWKASLDGSMLLTGLISGLVIFAAAMALYHGWLKQTDFVQVASLEVKQRVEEMGLLTPLSFIGLGVFYVLVHSLLEEYYWRWFVFGMWKDVTTGAAAMWFSSLGFMAHHVLVLARFFGWGSPATWFFSACVAVGGLIWSWIYWRSGKLYASWISHALVDAAIFVIGYDMLKF